VEKNQAIEQYEDLRGHYDMKVNQLAQYQKRLGEEIQNKKDLELNLESRLSDTRRLLEMKQREMD